MTAPPDLAALNDWWLEQAGRYAMALKSRRDQFRVLDGDRRMLGDRTPGRADLKIIREDQPCR
jgi:hypothetical protein